MHQNFQLFQPLNYLHVNKWIFIDMNMYTLTEGKKSQSYLKETTGLLSTVVTHLLKNAEHEAEFDIDSSYAVWKH